MTTDTSTLTAAGNDLGFDHIFARQIEALGKPGDVVIAISTSGKSPNVVAALHAGEGLGLVTAAFGGKTGGDMAPLADHLLAVPSVTAARIQEMHILLGQMLCGALEIELGLDRPDSIGFLASQRAIGGLFFVFSRLENLRFLTLKCP